MAKVKITGVPIRKKIIPIVMAVANGIIKQLRLVERINEIVSWDRNHWNISPGGLAKMLVMATFTDIRIPLTHLEDRLESIDVEYFLDPEDKSSFVNESNVGEALDRIAEIDYDGLYESIALSAMQTYKIPMERMHSDTTTISFYGEYDVSDVKLTEEEKEDVLKIERGYNKDGRPQSNQVVVGQVANDVGIPVVNKVLSGSTSDIEWNREAIQYIERMRESGFTTGLYVADSKLMIEEHITHMNRPETRIDFVSRCPANFCEKLEERMIYSAYTHSDWEEYEPFSDTKEATVYRGVGFTEEIYGAPMRLIVLESSSLIESAQRGYEKKEGAIQPLIKALTKVEYKCYADAQAACDRFMKEKQMDLFTCEYNIEKRITEKWPKGRRGPKTKVKTTETYHIHVNEIHKNEQAYQSFIQRESCIVIASNAVHKSDIEIIQAYKGQHVVENSFRALKSPQLASVIYLKSIERIQVLSMLLTFSLLVRALIQYRLREGLKEYRENNPKQSIRAGWGGKELKNPTFKLFYEHSINCCYERENNGCYSFAWPSTETKERVAPLLQFLGLSVETIL